VIRVLLRRFLTARRPLWRHVLPYQAARLVRAPEARSIADVCAALRPGVDYVSTPTAVYLTPEGLERSPLRSVRAMYPVDAGLKVLLRPADQADVDLLLLGALLHLHDLAPRIYDLLHLGLATETAVALVIRHVDGRPSGPDEWATVLSRLRRLGERGFLQPRTAAGWQDAAFQHGGAAARVDEDGRVGWDGVEHLELDDYEGFLEHLAVSAAGDTHFGNRGRQGQRYLYQSVPGVRLPAKRRVEDRMARVGELMAAARVALDDRLVLDVGCNLGMAMAHYLHRGARWCHGWDLPVVVPHAERMLLALGCTRFSMTAGRMSAEQPVEEDVPGFLGGALRGCVVSYLAIRGHLGWLSALGRVPWAFLIYEGHKAETEPALAEHLAVLARAVPFVRGPLLSHRESRRARPRLMTILVRPENL
jgi:hypothetical protein